MKIIKTKLPLQRIEQYFFRNVHIFIVKEKLIQTQ